MTKRNKWIQKGVWMAVYLFSLGALPALGFLSPVLQSAAENETSAGRAELTSPAPLKEEAQGKKAGFLLLDEGTGKTFSVSEEDYLFYATVCEMPASFEVEALRAQAVAAFTYAQYCKEHQTDKDRPILTVNCAAFQGYCREEDLKKLWGDKEKRYKEKLKKALEPLAGKAVLYRGKPILAAYFACSAGRTEDSALVWGGDMPYLKPVEMGADLQAKDSRKVVKLDQKETERRLKAFDREIELPEDPNLWFQKLQYSESRTVLSLQAGNRTLTGQQLRKMAGLPSASFSVAFEDGVFLFSCNGRGHGVGLSQNGANELAKAGMQYDEILKYFYTGTEVSDYLQDF